MCPSHRKGSESCEWRKGSCGAILAAVITPDMDPYYNFIEMILDEKSHLKYCSESNQIWIRVVGVCKTLESWLLSHAKDTTIDLDLREAIRSLADREPTMKRANEVVSPGQSPSKRHNKRPSGPIRLR